MMGLSKDMDLSFLGGRELIQVGFGLHQTILRFDADTSISIECDYEVGDQHNDQLGLISLLGNTVAKVSNPGDGSLIIEFMSGPTLVIRDSNRDFESYQVESPGKYIVV
jgi:hypothetical protein